MKQRFLLFLILLLASALFVSPLCAFAEDYGLVENGGFEQLDEYHDPEKWYESTYHDEPGYSRLMITDEKAHSGTYSAMVENASLNDARFITTAAVKPNRYYRLSGYVLVESMGEEGNGANFGLEDIASSSVGLYDTNGEWQYLEWYGKTGPGQRSLTFGVRVGGFGGESIGRAYFDDISLVEVKSVPAEAVPSLWYKVASETVTEPEEEKEEKNTLLFVVIALVYAAGALYLIGKAHKGSSGMAWATFAFIALGGLLLRLYLGMKVPGYDVDMGCFSAWATRMTNVGPAGFYADGYFCDYPPGYMLLLWPVGLLLRSTASGTATRLLVKFVPILFDMAAICFLFVTCKKRQGERPALLVTLLYALSPAVLVTGAAWGQADSVLTFVMLLCALYAVDKKWHTALPLYVLAVLMKPQALLFGPVLLIWLIAQFFRKENRDKASIRSLLIGVSLCFAVAIAVVLPFAIRQEKPIEWILGLYGETLTSYPYATLNTANLYYLLGANWIKLETIIPMWLPTVTLILSVLALGAMYFAFCIHKDEKLDIRNKHTQLIALLAVFTLFQLVLVFSRSTYSLYGYGMMALVYLFVLICLLHEKDAKRLPFFLALLLMGLYLLVVKIHERYLYPGLALLVLSFILTGDKRMLRLFAGFTVTTFVNIAVILENSIRYGASMGHLNNDTIVLNVILCIANMLLLCYGVYVALTDRESAIIGEKTHLPQKEVRLPDGYRKMLTSPQDAKLHLSWKDFVIMGAVSLVYGVMAFANLGSTVAPQHGWISSSPEETVVFELEEDTDFYFMYYCGVSKYGFSVSVSEDGENWSEPYPCEMREGLCYRWNYAITSTTDESGKINYGDNSPLGRITFNGKFLRINAEASGLNMFEAAFRNTDGELIPAKIVSHENPNPEILDEYTPPAALLDEQETCVGEPGWYTGTYFDEIYHARTAYEHLHGQRPYETTHPPLGKLLMAAGIAVFGMTPFGWRFAGALVGVLMLPVLYLLAKQIFRRRDLATLAMSAFALDLMHYTQTRIATIDSFPVFFILLSYLFMVRYMQTDVFAIEEGEAPRLFSKAFIKSLLPLFLSGIAMGLSIASKWIGMYSAVGLALLFFVTIIRQYRAADMSLLLTPKELGPENEKRVAAARQFTFKRIVITCGFCVVFFILIPALIYYVSYIPYLAPTGKVTVQRVWECQLGMYNYHSTPGLGMDHPFHATWYQWPFLSKPMWFAQDKFEPAGYASTIMCFGNPWVFYIGAVCMVAVILCWMLKYLRKEEAWKNGDGNLTLLVLVTGFAAQYLPWVLVPRGTYMYHYFASVPFIILATVWCVSLIPDRLKKLRYAVIGLYLIGALAFFVMFFPYASGWLTNTEWLNAMKWFSPRLYY